MAVPPDKQLQLYNAALKLCKERTIANLTADEKSRRTLDEVWNRHKGALDHCLMEGLWNFATRTVKIEYTGDVTQEFGYRYAYDKPDDWVRTVEMSADEDFTQPLLNVRDEAGYWFAEVTPIYVRFVSRGDDYGGNPNLWPQTFFDYFAAYLASEVVWQLTQSGDIMGQVMDEHERRLDTSRSKDAMDEPTRFVAMGRWSQARWGRRRNDDRGSRNRLIG